MKRVLALVLALMMVVSGMVFVTSAAEADVIVLDTGADMGYFKTSAADGAFGAIDGVACMTNTKSGAVGPNEVRFRFAPVAMGNADFFVDVTGMEYLCFDFYTSNAAVLKDVTTLFEVSSGGVNDVANANKQVAFSEFAPDLKDGWNTISVKLADLNNASFDYAHFNYFRLVFNSTYDAGAGLTVGMKNVRFTKVAGAGADEPAELPAVYVIKEDTLMDVKPFNALKEAAYVKQVKLDNAIDISGYKYYKFDLNVTNAAALKAANTTLRIELTSAGKADAEEWQVNATIDSLIEGGLKDGLNTAVLDLDKAGADLNKSAFNFTRIFTAAVTLAEGAEASYTISNIRLEKEAVEEDVVVLADEVINQSLTAQAYANAAFLKEIKLDAPMDINNYKFFKFDVEVTGAEALKAASFGLNVELTSSGTCDQEEWQVNKSLDSMLGGSLKDGLNTVVFDLGSASPDLNKAAFNFVRIFTNPFQPAGEASFAIKNVRLEKGEDAGGDEEDANVEKLEFKVYDKATEDLYLVRSNAGTAGDKRFSDGTLESVYKFTVKSTDAVKSVVFKATTWGNLLLQLSTDPDAEDSSTIDWIELYNAGAQVVDQTEREYDLTEYLVDENGSMPATFYIRIADSTIEDGCGGSICTDTVAGVYVTTECPTRKYTFRVDEKSEEKYLVRCTGQTNAGCRFNDGSAETVYRFTIKDTEGVKKILWNVTVGGQLWLQFTTADASKTSEGIEWVDIYKYEAAEGDPVDKCPDLGAQSYDLTSLLVNEDGSLKANTFYLRIADSVEPGGWGGNILTKVDQTLLVMAAKVEAPEAVEPEPVSEFENAVLKYTVNVDAGGLYCFTTIAHPDYEIKEGDYLVYQVRMDGAARDGHMGGIDMNFTEGVALRDRGVRDTDGVSIHPTENLRTVRDNIWYTRTVDLTAVAGNVIKDFQLSMHLKDAAAEAVEWTAYYDNIIIYNASGVAKCIIYQDDTDVPTAEYADGPANGTKSKVENVECPAYEHEYAIFTPLDDTDPGTEAPYLVESNAGNNGSCRFSDTSLHTIYKFDIQNTLSVERVLFTAVMGQQMLFSVSMDGENWTEVYKWHDDAAKAASAGNGWKITEHTIDLTNAVDFSISKTIYIKIEDSYPEDGWGGSIYKDGDAMLDVWYVQLSDEELDAYEAKPSAHVIPLFGANTEFGGWKLDKENKLNGSACLTKQVGKGSADSIVLDTPIDATGMDTFEFDIWVSDLSFFDKFAAPGMNSGFEITSSGKCDNQERSWNLAQIRDKNEGDVLIANTWCHVILPLSTSAVNEEGGPLNLAAVNYIRFFFVNETEDTGITVKLDDLKFTDYVAQKEKAAEEEAAPAIEKMAALKDATFTDDNAKSLKSDITKARKAYDKLSDAAKAKVPADVLKYLTDAEKARDAYDASKETTPTPTAEPTGDPTGEPTGTNVTDTPTPTEGEGEDDGGNKTVIIIIIVAVVVIAAGVCLWLFVFKKKKK